MSDEISPGSDMVQLLLYAGCVLDFCTNVNLTLVRAAYLYLSPTQLHPVKIEHDLI